MIEELRQLSNQAIQDAANELLVKHRGKVASALTLAFANAVKDPNKSDSLARLALFNKRIQSLADQLKLTLALDGLSFVASAEGDAGQTLTYLIHGTSWFDGQGQAITDAIVSAALG